MRLHPEELEALINDVLNKIQLDLLRANAQDELDKILEKYGLKEIFENAVTACDFYKSNIRGAKILVLAIEFPNVDKRKLTAKKKYNIPKDRIEFQVVKTNFDYSKLRNTAAYSDIIVGPIPHKGVGIGDNTSFLAEVEHHREEYPKVHRMQDGAGTLMLSQSAFEKCLANTNLVKECLE